MPSVSDLEVMVVTQLCGALGSDCGGKEGKLGLGHLG